MAFKRICRTCGKEYDYCPNCLSYAARPKWMANWDSEECKDVWNILIRYNTEHISKDEVAKVLESYNVVNYSKYSSPIASQLKKILAVSHTYEPKTVINNLKSKNNNEKKTFSKS